MQLAALPLLDPVYVAHEKVALYGQLHFVKLIFSAPSPGCVTKAL